MDDRGVTMGGVWLVLVFVAVVPASVAGSGGMTNGTFVGGGNDGTMQLLMASSVRQFTAESCVESVTRMRRFVADYFTSYPPADFTPPGAQEWCECLEGDSSGIAGLPKPNFFDPDAPKELFEEAFDRCRATVLEGSEFNTQDICRGMFDLFGKDLGENYVTFCGRLCRDLNNDYYYYVYSVTGLNMYYGCGTECAAEAMPGYCSKFKVWYTDWKPLIYRYDVLNRIIGVGDKGVIVQSARDFGRTQRRFKAQRVCDALSPLLGGNINECCNYPRAFAALSQCCALNGDGKSVFDCEHNFAGSRTLYYECVNNLSLAGIYLDDYYYLCRDFVIDNYNPSMSDMKVWKDVSQGVFLFTFEEADLFDFCSERDGGMCCRKLESMNIAANCVDPSTLEYVGRTTTPMDGPTPPAGGDDDPCFRLCEDGRDCVLAGNRAPFCVDCTAFLKPRRSGLGDLVECCQYDSTRKKCVSVLKSEAPGICRRSEEIFVLADDGTSQTVEFRKQGGYACKSPRDFRDSGAACKVVVTDSGQPKCFE